MPPTGKDKMLRDPDLLEVFDTVGKVGGLAMVHPENGDIVEDNQRRMMAAGQISISYILYIAYRYNFIYYYIFHFQLE